MSFLLDALSKADQDRNRDEVPQLHSPGSLKASYWRKFGLICILMLSLISAFALGFIARSYYDNTATKTIASPTLATVKPPLSKADLSQENDPSEAAKDNQAKPQMAHNLSVISYSDVPAIRFAIINEEVVNEGDLLSSGEQILEIQIKKVLLEKQGHTTWIGLTE